MATHHPSMPSKPRVMKPEALSYGACTNACDKYAIGAAMLVGSEMFTRDQSWRRCHPASLILL